MTLGAWSAIPDPSPLGLSIDVLELILAALSLALTAVAALAYRRTRARRMAFITAAFATFFARVVVVEQLLVGSSVAPDMISIARLVFDLATIILFALAVMKG